MQAAGLEAWADEVNNVFGRLPGGLAPWLLVGSHTDTVPAGGRLDGAYGVIAGLEVLTALHEAGHPAGSRVEVVSFHDEEGVNGSGGLTGSRALLRHRHAEELCGYLEIHIEQGPVLEAEGAEVGVVEGIVGIRRFNVLMQGEANHAGTTPYAARRDAGAAAAKLTWRLREILQDVDPGMVGNVGVIGLEPGSPNVVPGRARLVVETRSVSMQSLDRAQEAVAVAAASAAADFGCRASVEVGLVIDPVQLDPGTVATLVEVCEQSGLRWRRMASGAGHDAGTLAARVPAGMLFVPSRMGVSHSPREHTDDRLLVQGAQLLLAAVLKLTSKK
ncbi:MAG TPA: hydantoinase/carbamoylase family amidase [Candidatus Dormibacteraeota bacterium]|nr:hydantoinase/carbamoylase family amidase [Candidatus Dormibacteraeota bacterium]